MRQVGSQFGHPAPGLFLNESPGSQTASEPAKNGNSEKSAAAQKVKVRFPFWVAQNSRKILAPPAIGVKFLLIYELCATVSHFSAMNFLLRNGSNNAENHCKPCISFFLRSYALLGPTAIF